MTHSYLSTACLHMQHNDCLRNVNAKTGMAKKPGSCKYCEAPCHCPCHQLTLGDIINGMNLGVITADVLSATLSSFSPNEVNEAIKQALTKGSK
jgi:hypothetical protein